MKKSLIFVIVGFIVALCLPLSPVTAGQRDIFVPDAGFEDHVLNDEVDWFYLADDTITAWKSVAGTGGAWIGWNYYGVWLAFNGNNKVYGYYETDNDYIYQILDETFIEGKTYTLSVWVGSGWSGYDHGWWLYFTGEDYTNELTQASGSAPVFSWQQVSCVYTATAADAGKKIGIKLQGDAWVTFDDVTLSYGPPKTRNPNPADGALVLDTWANLSWSPGDKATSHDVYIGDNFDNVNAGAESTFQGNQTAMLVTVGFPGFLYPDGLVPGMTYYWRIDAVNEAEPNSPWKGDIWSFSIPPRTAYNPDPADSADSVKTNAELSWTGGFGSKLHTIYFGDNFDEVNNAAGGLPQGTLTYNPGPLQLAKTYYWRVDEFDVVETHKGDVWSFTTEGAVQSVIPLNGAVDVTQTPVLTWAPGFGASHEVYFGADAASLELKASGNFGSESYDPGQLEWNTTYYWRVDEANNANADSPWTGPLWSFTTANFLIVDDFESYNDLDEGDPGSNRLYLAWIDGFDSPATNGSVVGNLNPPFAEQTIVHSGLQSMPMAYDNTVGKSEATSVLTSSRDWTVKGVNTLTIWYRGASANAAEPMYVVINDGAVVTNDNPNAALASSWTEWNIDLQTFADQGVNLANVNSITLGLGNRSNPVAGGSGMMYFDDIRLHPPTP
ncbi:MAG: hypothetical protein H8D56_11570 [Planctomycetes bacterium]|nr:hypothetical protein [Planctomycetota bacterium]